MENTFQRTNNNSSEARIIQRFVFAAIDLRYVSQLEDVMSITNVMQGHNVYFTKYEHLSYGHIEKIQIHTLNA